MSTCSYTVQASNYGCWQRGYDATKEVCCGISNGAVMSMCASGFIFIFSVILCLILNKMYKTHEYHKQLQQGMKLRVQKSIADAIMQQHRESVKNNMLEGMAGVDNELLIDDNSQMGNQIQTEAYESQVDFVAPETTAGMNQDDIFA